MDKVSVGKNKLFIGAVVIAALNPFFSGLIIGLIMLTEPGLKKEGRIVTVFSLAWGVIALMLLSKFKHLFLV